MLWMTVIPLASLLFLYYKFRNEVSWWEWILPPGVSILAIFFCQSLCDYALSSDTEFHGGIATKCVWDESWTETYYEMVTETDSRGNTSTHMETRTRYHSDEYKVEDTNGYNVSVDKEHYKKLRSKWNNEKAEHPWRSGQSSWGDGRRFTTLWPNTEEDQVPCFTAHRYENRIVRSRSLFKLKIPTENEKKKFALVDYPEIYDYHYQKSIIGWQNRKAEESLTRFNSEYGRIKQVRVFIIVFVNQPLEAGFKQQALWQNANKNELVLCLSVSKANMIDWVYPFCWDNDKLKIDLREAIAEQKELDMEKVVQTTTKLVLEEFHRKSFKDFEYVTLDPPGWAVGLCFVFIVFVNVGVALWVIYNQFKGDV